MNKKIAIINLITKTSLLKKTAPKVISNKDAMIVKFAKELQKYDLDIDLYVSDSYRPEKKEDLGINIIYLKTFLKSIFWPSCIPFTPALFSKVKNKYDIIICSEAFQWSTFLAIISKIFSFKKKAKIIIWQEMANHQRMLKKIPSKFYHRFLLKPFLDKHIDLYIPRGRLSKLFLSHQNIRVKKITEPISHGYDQTIFYCDESIKKKSYIFSPSRLVDCKGIDILLKGFAIFSRQKPEIKLIIQGDGPQFNKYKSMAKDLNIEDKVSFNRTSLNHDKMRLMYSKALLTIIASRSDLEIFSSMESIACGTPIIISSGADSHMNYMDGKSGIVFKTGDYNQLSKILFNTVSNLDLLNKMQKNAVEQASTCANTTIVKNFNEIIGTLSE